MNCNPVPHGIRNHPLARRFGERPYFSADSGLQLDLGDRAKRRLNEMSSPCGLLSRSEDKLKLSDDVILLDTPFIRNYGACQQHLRRIL
jgi:hypothetical protein